jgi:hypothetical protein
MFRYRYEHLGKREHPDTGAITYSLRSGDEVERIPSEGIGALPQTIGQWWHLGV